MILPLHKNGKNEMCERFHENADCYAEFMKLVNFSRSWWKIYYISSSSSSGHFAKSAKYTKISKTDKEMQILSESGKYYEYMDVSWHEFCEEPVYLSHHRRRSKSSVKKGSLLHVPYCIYTSLN